MPKFHWLKNYNKNQPWANEIPNHEIDPNESQRKANCTVPSTRSIRPSILRMSSRIHNEFGIQFPRKRLPNLKMLPARQSYQPNTMTRGTP